MNETSTIAALATAPAPAGVAIVRVSGPAALQALRAHFSTLSDPSLHPHRLLLGRVIDHGTGQAMDRALAVFMPAPRSFTGEDVAEFHLHGSPILARQLLRSLYCSGIAPAEPGEFTKRAFLNGKLDLVQAEAVCDLIEATGAKALSLAGQQLQGDLSRAAAGIGEPLREILAEIEASLDFPEEEMPHPAPHDLHARLSQTAERLCGLLATYRYGHSVREGFRVLLWGRPNTGKSSLLNRLLGRERAIVTEISGTTRDLIEESLEIDGFRFVFCDTAGFTEDPGRVEQIAVDLAKQRVPWADLVLCLVDAADQSGAWREVLAPLAGGAQKVWLVTNKIDLNPKAAGRIHDCPAASRQDFYISAKSGEGLDALRNALAGEVLNSRADQGEAGVTVTNERHRNCLARALDAVRRALGTLQQRMPPEITALELRSTLAAMDELIGATSNEDILGRIFSRFCIGK